MLFDFTEYKTAWWQKIPETREPDVYIGGKTNTYLRRWHVIKRNPYFNIYLHQFLRSDDDRALHDHPWINLSILLAGQYLEHTISAGGINHKTLYKAGDWKFRMPSAAHRVELIDGKECWSLFITGPKVRDWGFHCPRGWRIWTDFVDNKGNESHIGKGCD